MRTKRPDLKVRVHISRRGRPRKEEGAQSYAGIKRYLISEGIPLRTVDSFIRLAKTSRYRKRQNSFVFGSCHTYLSEPRFEMLREGIGVESVRHGDKSCYQKDYVWIVEGEHGERLMEPLIELVFPER